MNNCYSDIAYLAHYSINHGLQKVKQVRHDNVLGKFNYSLSANIMV